MHRRSICKRMVEDTKADCQRPIDELCNCTYVEIRSTLLSQGKESPTVLLRAVNIAPPNRSEIGAVC